MSQLLQDLLVTLSSSDSDCASRIIHELAKEEGYTVVSDNQENFLFCTPPDGEPFIPVLLCAHWDTRRTGIPAVRVLTDGTTIINTKGILGADDRAGVQMLLDISKAYKEKPLLLFTNYEESGMHGMKEFIRHKDLLEPYLDELRLIISADRRGTKDAVSASIRQTTPPELVEFVESFGYKHVIGLYTDSCLLEEQFGVAAINVSVGFEHQHSITEYLNVNSYIECRERLTRMLGNVTEWYTPLIPEYTMVHQKPRYWDYDVTWEDVTPMKVISPIPVCDICGRADRQATFNVDAQIYVCKACENRAQNYCTYIHKGNIHDLINGLALERTQTRRANAVMNKNKGVKLPPCPRCRTNERVVWHEPSNTFVCLHCKEETNTGFNGRFWKVWNKQLKMKQLMWVQDSTVIRHNMRLAGPVMSMKRLANEPLLRTCAVCKQLTTRTFEVECVKNNDAKYIGVCPECASELLVHQQGPTEPWRPAITPDIHHVRVTQGSEDTLEVPF